MQIKLEDVIDNVLSGDKSKKGATIISNLLPDKDNNNKESMTIYVNGEGKDVIHLMTHICDQVMAKQPEMAKFALLLSLSERLLGGEKNGN